MNYFLYNAQFSSYPQRRLLRLPLPGGGFFVFVRFPPPAAAASHSVHRLHPFFQKVRENIRGTAAICILFSSNNDLVTLISTKPLFRFTLFSTYWMQVLIPRLHEFFKNFRRISGSWRPFLIFFFNLGPCHFNNFKATYPIYSIFNILYSSCIS